MKNKYAQWNAELQAKLRDFREQKRNWTIEIAALQASDAQHKVRSETQCSMESNKVLQLDSVRGSRETTWECQPENL